MESMRSFEKGEVQGRCIRLVGSSFQPEHFEDDDFVRHVLTLNFHTSR